MLTWRQVEQKAALAHRAFFAWRQVSVVERAALLRRLIVLLQERSAHFATIITQEMGKPVVQAEYELGKCVRGGQFYLEQGDKFLQPILVPSDAGKSFIRYDPLGTILGIMPWNFPFWQVIRFAIPVLLAANVVLLKHAPNVPACALALERLFQDAGFPKGVFQSLFVSNACAERLIESDHIQGVSLTGSDRAGRAVAAAAGRGIKKSVLELGGSDPFVVFADADLDKCVPIAVQSRMLNSGQSCIAAKRMIVVREIANDFIERLVEGVKKLKMGDPMDRTTDIGPLARKDLRENLVRQTNLSIRKGARVLWGGVNNTLPDPLQRGYFFPPTVLQAKPEMPITTEETFGPLATILVAKDEPQAIQLANQTAYGLGASLWTRDLERAEHWIPQIEAGSVFVNGMVKSDPRLPFGGVKRSGYGRELSHFGMHEFVNIKTVWIAS